MPLTSVLCFDGSDEARYAIQRAGELLRPHAAIVVHVGDDASVAEAGVKLATSFGFSPVIAVQGDGTRISEVLIMQARHHDAGLIVVGSQGLTGYASTFLGSVSSAIVHHCDRPVLVVRPREGAADGPVFIGYDGSPEARGAIEFAGTVLVGGEAIVASFLEPVDDVAMLRTSLPWSADAELEARLGRLHRGEMDALAARSAEGAVAATAAGLRATPATIEAPGPAWAQLLDAAADNHAACIVVGHRRMTHLGSTAYGMVHHADRPVLVVPS